MRAIEDEVLRQALFSKVDKENINLANGCCGNMADR